MFELCTKKHDRKKIINDFLKLRIKHSFLTTLKSKPGLSLSTKELGRKKIINNLLKFKRNIYFIIISKSSMHTWGGGNGK